eukprot:g2274.t1
MLGTRCMKRCFTNANIRIILYDQTAPVFSSRVVLYYAFCYVHFASNTVAQRVKHFLAEMEKEDLRFLSEEQIVDFLKMSQAERDAYAARGGMQKAAMGYFLEIEKKMTSIESKERNTGKTNKVLRLLSSSGEKQNVEQLKSIRKQHGAQSKAYKEALTTLEK